MQKRYGFPIAKIMWCILGVCTVQHFSSCKSKLSLQDRAILWGFINYWRFFAPFCVQKLNSTSYLTYSTWLKGHWSTMSTKKAFTQWFICPDALLSFVGESICRSMISLLIKNHPQETTLIHFKANLCQAVTLGFCDIFYQITKSSRDFALIVQALSSPFPPFFPMFKII